MLRSRPEGFTLVEVLIASAVFVTLSVGIAHLFAVAGAAGVAARTQTSASILAAAKLEQLRSLTWRWRADATDAPTLPESDLTTNLSTSSPGHDGRGLRESPVDTLSRNIPPYVDYLDETGQWVGNGSAPPAGCVFVRRWSVRGLPADPHRTLILQVLVISVREHAVRGALPWARRSGSEAVLTTVRTRTGL
ncbi:MAG TPA: prepilin-type N-terminal cleavage/methylation domain-containing protein [Vicinamibacterales bacterium]|nr:prepilin-type N-terminal cleavage/methylation domain-containing protein [Vicinamibacterales bacterium]